MVTFLLLLVPLAGCSGVLSDAPRTQEAPIELIGNSSVNTTYTVEIFLVNTSTTLDIRRNDGKSHSRKVDGYSLSAEPTDGYHYTSVDPEPARFVANLTIGPGEVVEREVRNRPVDSLFLIVVYDENSHITDYFMKNCGGYDFISVETEIAPYGVGLHERCS
ncbi:hypothetical protein ACFPYI_16320 [Halomarina salina]|uniref:Secreted protein n=1 Tax=Halomarina salina TaxID=1872699 RepID=A0ABD5RR52_9EURY|nr:hypothetical protein [Halomarina salina]